jgi:probable F420-dependent oxidoreductase
VKIDGQIMNVELERMAERAARMEALGYDGLFTTETRHDPFLPLVIAAEHSEGVELGTAIAVAFPRSPMHLANIGHDLQTFSRGRFILGLGSQIKAHVEKRFSATWSKPVERMRELILAVRAIWRSWNDGEPLRFEGEFYRHTLMTPFFNPGPTGFGPPRVFLAAVGERMTEVVGECCDGMMAHGFTTARYLREHTLPALERGLARAGRSRGDIQICLPLFMVTGANDQEYEQADEAVRRQIAFYGSTPAYRPVLETHGWGDLQNELNTLSKRGQWVEMGKLITDEVLDAFSVQGRPDELPGLVQSRYGDVVDRLSFYAPYRENPEMWADVVRSFKEGD